MNYVPPQPQITPESLKTPFALAVGFLLGGLVLSIILIGVFLIIPGVVFYCIFLYRAWAIIQGDESRTTPGQAVGFMFIPIFNLYWIFVAFLGLTKDMNAYTQNRGINAPRANEGFALTACILSVVSIIPLLGYVTALVSIVFWVLALVSIKNAAVAIAEHNASTPAAA